MNDDEIINALASTSPSARARAALELKATPSSVQSLVLLKAIQAETVPRIRETLNEVLELRQRFGTGDNSHVEDVQAAALEVEQAPTFPDIGRTIHHELEPAIGRLRSAANREIESFATSRTNTAIVKLVRRVEGLVALFKTRQDLEIREFDLGDLVVSSWPDSEGRPTMSGPAVAASAAIQTDEMLFCLLLANAFQNALDAASEIGEAHEVRADWGVAGERYWVTITNPFQGHHLNGVTVEGTGSTTKIDHQGHGLSLMKVAAELLAITFELRGDSGIATFALAGSVRVE